LVGAPFLFLYCPFTFIGMFSFWMGLVSLRARPQDDCEVRQSLPCVLRESFVLPVKEFPFFSPLPKSFSGRNSFSLRPPARPPTIGSSFGSLLFQKGIEGNLIKGSFANSAPLLFSQRHHPRPRTGPAPPRANPLSGLWLFARE